MDELRGTPMSVGSMEEMIDDNHCIVSTSNGPEYVDLPVHTLFPTPTPPLTPPPSFPTPTHIFLACRTGLYIFCGWVVVARPVPHPRVPGAV